MTSIFVDFDNTIVESNQGVIDILNNRYNLTKGEEDLRDYGYCSIFPISEREKLDIFESNDFFKNLQFKEGFLDFFQQYKDTYKFVVTTKGTPLNIEKKQAWIHDNISPEIEVVGIPYLKKGKRSVNMRSGIQIDDCTFELNTNAKIKILFKSDNNFSWQKGYTNSDIIVVNTWKEIEEIINFFNEYDYRYLHKRVI